MLSDGELIINIKNGDMASFETLVKKYQTRLLSFSLGILKDYSLAEEVVQDTFLAVYTKINHIDIDKKFSSYLFQIAKNKALDVLRKQKKTLPLEEAILIPSAENIEERIIKKEDKKSIREALKSLKKKYRDILNLYYFEELSYKEIGEKVTMPLGTVKTNLLRAKKEIKKLMEDK